MRSTKAFATLFALSVCAQTGTAQAFDAEAVIDWTDGDGDAGFFYFLTDLAPWDGLDARLEWTQLASDISWSSNHTLLPLAFARDWGTTPLEIHLQAPAATLVADADELRVQVDAGSPSTPFGFIVARSGNFLLGPHTQVTFEVPAEATWISVGDPDGVEIRVETMIWGIGPFFGGNTFASNLAINGESRGGRLRIDFANPTPSEEKGYFIAQINIDAVAAPVPEPDGATLLIAGLGLLAMVLKRKHA